MVFDSHHLCIRMCAKSTRIKKHKMQCNSISKPTTLEEAMLPERRKEKQGCFVNQRHNSGFSRSYDLKDNLQSLEVLP